MDRKLLSNAATALRMAVILGLVLGLGGACVEVAGAESPSMGVRVSAMPIVSPIPDVVRVVQWGRRFADQHGCSGCHSIDGRKLVGPTWLNLYGSEVEIEGVGSSWPMRNKSLSLLGSPVRIL